MDKSYYIIHAVGIRGGSIVFAVIAKNIIDARCKAIAWLNKHNFEEQEFEAFNISKFEKAM